MTRNEVIELLESGVDSAKVAEAAQGYGIAFAMTAEAETQLRDAGATDELMRALRKLAPKPAAAPPPTAQPAAPPAAGPPVLLVEVTPGGAQVYVDDEPIGTTSQAGRLKLSQLPPGAHNIRVSLAGHRDLDQSVDLIAGQTAHVGGTLNAAATSSQPPTFAAGNLLSGVTAPPASPPPATMPAATYSAAHDHGSGGQDYCVGAIVIGGGAVAYRGTNGQHTFNFSAAEIKEAKKNAVYLAALGGFHIRLKSGPNYNFVVLNAAGQYQRPDELLRVIAMSMGQN